MFGCYAVYVGEKIVLILRNRNDHPDDNGVWIATTPEHHSGLKTMFPHMRSIQLLGEKTTSWQNLPSTSPDFEERVMDACDLILRNDPRIGKVPQKKRKKKDAVRKR